MNRLVYAAPALALVLVGCQMAPGGAATTSAPPGQRWGKWGLSCARARRSASGAHIGAANAVHTSAYAEPNRTHTRTHEGTRAEACRDDKSSSDADTTEAIVNASAEPDEARANCRGARMYGQRFQLQPAPPPNNRRSGPNGGRRGSNRHRALQIEGHRAYRDG